MTSPAAAASPRPGHRRDRSPEGQVRGRRGDDERQPQHRPSAAVAGRHRLRIPPAAEHQQAAERAERGVRTGGVGRHPRRVGVHGTQQRGDQPGQAARTQDSQRGRAGREPPPGRDRPGPARAEHGGRHHHQRRDAHRREPAGGGRQQPGQQPPRAGPGGYRAGHRRPQRPGQPGVTEQQGPLADDEPLGHERVPGVADPGGQPREPGLPVEQGRPARAGQHEDRQQQELLRDVGRHHPGERGQHRVAGHRPGGAAGQPEHRGGEGLPGHRHHVVAEQESPPQARAQGQQPQGQARTGRGQARGPGPDGLVSRAGPGRPGRGRRRYSRPRARASTAGRMLIAACGWPGRHRRLIRPLASRGSAARTAPAATCPR